MVSKYGAACLHCMALLSIQLNYVMVSGTIFFFFFLLSVSSP